MSITPNDNYVEYDELIDDEDLYSSKSRSEMLDNDEISSGEDGFLEGYDYAETELHEDKNFEEETQEY